MQFSEIHVFRGRENRGSFIVGPTTKCLFVMKSATEFAYDSAVQNLFYYSEGLSGGYPIGFQGHLVEFLFPFYSLRVTVSHLTVGGAILKRTGITLAETCI